MLREKEFRIEFGVEFNARYKKEIEIIKLYTPKFDEKIVNGIKALGWYHAQYRPEKQNGKFLYWVIAKKMLPQVLELLKRNEYETNQQDILELSSQIEVSTKDSFIEFDTTEDELKVIEEIVYPNTGRWAERVLREQKNFEILMSKNPNLNIEFNVDNSREILITMKDLDLNFSILLPIRYPEKIPVTRLDGKFKESNFVNHQPVVSYKRVISACLGAITKNWNKKRTIAHFIKLFISYLTALYFNEPTPEVENEYEEEE